MRHLLTALVAAVEAVLISLAGIALIAVPTLLIGVVTLSLGVDISTLTATIAGIWVLGHGGGMAIDVSEAQALGLGLGPEPFTFVVSLAPLLLALITASLAWRMGYRFSTDVTTGAAAITGGSLGFIGSAASIALFAGPLAQAPVWAVTALASLWFVLPAWGGFLLHHTDMVSNAWFKLKVGVEQAGAPRLGWGAERYVARTLKLFAIIVLGVLLLGALGVTAALFFGFVDIMSLTQAMQLDFIGTLTFFFGQLAYLPTVILWAISWFAGPGFAVGVGSNVTPFETLLGPLPSVPLFAAIPDAWGAWGFLAIVLVILLGIVLGALFGTHPEYRVLTLWRLAVMSAVASALAGLLFALLFALASGSIGPGRLETVGPVVWASAGALALELAVGFIGGFALTRNSEFVTRTVGAVGLDDVPETASPQPRHDEAELVELDVEEHTDGGYATAVIHSGEREAVRDAGEKIPDDADAQPTEVVSRIANLVSETGEIWYRKAAKPRKQKQEPVFDPDKLAEQFLWESTPEDEPTHRDEK